MKKILAIIVCVLLGSLSVITYYHMIAPHHDDYVYMSQDELPNGVSYDFNYVNSQECTISLGYTPYGNVVIPSEIIKDGTAYKVVGVCKEYGLDCDTLFIPKTILYIDNRQMLGSSADINYISVDANNKHYRSVDGNLYKGDILIFDTKSKHEE